MVISVDSFPAGKWWNDLVESSKQGCIFNAIWFLDSLGVPYRLFKVSDDSGSLLAGFCVLEDLVQEKMRNAPHPFTPYQGILFHSRLTSLNNNKRITEEFKITENIIEKMVGRYKNFNMCMSPNFLDIRPFLWHNYSDAEAPKFTITNRYTAILALRDFSINQYLSVIRASRRQEYKKNISRPLMNCSIDDFLSIYQETFSRQGILLDSDTLGLVRRICVSALQNNAGYLNKIMVNGEIASASLFLYDRTRAYYLFGANNPKYRSSGASTALMIANIQKAVQLECEELDFVGVNSPNRGDYKLSFNGLLKSYFQVNLNTNA
jgi:lipid II:glycine glycyltransferase (peptidoglycan interpeptide bridge formation enzyme)